jgi:glutamate-5-semialdehyde dehydrogenase
MVRIMGKFTQLRDASRKLQLLKANQRDLALNILADLIHEHSPSLINASELDLKENGESMTNANRARLILDSKKISQLVLGIRQVAKLSDPVGKTLDATVLDENLLLTKVSVPLGVLGVIFESRADVAPQIISLALRTANGVVMKAGSESKHVNSEYQKILIELSTSLEFLPNDWCQIYHQREIVKEMLAATEEIDLIIPRGSYELVKSVSENTKIPVLGHAAGVCHLYIHQSADLEKALNILFDAKLQYSAACNAIETVLIDNSLATTFIPKLITLAKERALELRGDEEFCKYDPSAIQIKSDAWNQEYGDAILAVKVVKDHNQAIEHINKYGSHHTDAIVAKSESAINTFLNRVDSANVYSNCSTRFADGFRYGFGAEIGISTGRIHARGPVGIDGLMTYKYILEGDGQIVADYVGEDAKAFLHLRKTVE